MTAAVVAPRVTLGQAADAPVRSGRRRMRVDTTGLVGGGMLLLIGAACVAAPLLSRHDPIAVNLLNQFQPPGWAHPLGTDNFGRDIWARVLHGGRVSLTVAGLATAAALLLSVVLGGLAGYLGGAVDMVVTRVIELMLAFPRLVLAIAIAGLLGVGVTSVLIAIVAVSWATYARIIRGMVLQAREEPYVLAAHALGSGSLRVLIRHLTPVIAGRVAVLASLDFGYLILNVSALSFLGLGVQPPHPEWGAMLNESRLFYAMAPELMLYPGAAIFLTVLSANLLGDALRDALDPRRVVR